LLHDWTSTLAGLVDGRFLGLALLNAWRPSLPAGLRGQRGALKSACASPRSKNTSCCSSSLSGQEGSDDGASTRPQPLSCLIRSRNPPVGQPLLVVGLRCPTHRLLPAGQRRSNAGVQWAKCSSTTQCSAQRTAPCCTASTNVQPLNVGYHLHCAVAPICQRQPWFSFLGLHCYIMLCLALPSPRNADLASAQARAAPARVRPHRLHHIRLCNTGGVSKRRDIGVG
jgi:hypothetical protein